MTEYPFVTLNREDIEQLRVERLRGLECELVRVQLQMAEPLADIDLGRRHDELVARMEVHRQALGLDSAHAGEPDDGNEKPGTAEEPAPA